MLSARRSTDIHAELAAQHRPNWNIAIEQRLTLRDLQNVRELARRGQKSAKLTWKTPAPP
jgi:hypothetical protein